MSRIGYPFTVRRVTPIKSAIKCAPSRVHSSAQAACSACQTIMWSNGIRCKFCSSGFPYRQPKSHQAGQSRGSRIVTRMGKKATNGPFTPIVVVARNQIGTKQFNQLRGKAISLHSQVIKDFCKNIGAEGKQVQSLIRLAKQNGEKLGFLS